MPMSIRHFSLLAIATVFLSTNLVQANEIPEATKLADLDLAAGDMQILVTESGARILTPAVQLHSLPLTNAALISRTYRRTRAATIRNRRSIQSTTQRPNNARSQKNQKVVSQTSSSTIRSSNNSSQVTNRQHQSIQCSAEDNGNSTVSQSTSTTINGQTVSSRVSNSCK
jgi:hypothetical protein